MKNAKYQCKIICKHLITNEEQSRYIFTNHLNKIKFYAKMIADPTSIFQRMDIINNSNGELLMIFAYKENYFYITPSAHKLASKILRKI